MVPLDCRVGTLSLLAMTGRRLSGGIEEVFAAEQAPGDDDEGGKGNAEYHAEYTAEGSYPKRIWQR